MTIQKPREKEKLCLLVLRISPFASSSSPSFFFSRDKEIKVELEIVRLSSLEKKEGTDGWGSSVNDSECKTGQKSKEILFLNSTKFSFHLHTNTFLRELFVPVKENQVGKPSSHSQSLKPLPSLRGSRTFVDFLSQRKLKQFSLLTCCPLFLTSLNNIYFLVCHTVVVEQVPGSK